MGALGVLDCHSVFDDLLGLEAIGDFFEVHGIDFVPPEIETPVFVVQPVLYPITLGIDGA
ncbi:hypothetical protein K3729_18420 (plasmid) [Rhodobacteraceae bacterium S2214]|nr:hypothetical protein K3729_18420 [Rhodobacteraceae bacterium S2214]